MFIKTDSWRRIVSGAGANIYGQIVSIAIQVLSVPLFLSYWDLQTYGTWLIISTVPAYIGIADLGIFSAVSNRVTLHTSRADWHAANKTFHAGVSAFLVLALLLLIGIAVLSMNVKYMPEVVVNNFGAICGSLAISGLMFLGPLFDAKYRAAGCYARGMCLISTARIFDLAGALLALHIESSVSSASYGALLGRLVSSVLLYIDSSWIERKLRWMPKEICWDEVKSLALPSFSMAAFTIGNALGVQTATLVIGYMAGAAVSAIFNTYRTLSRVVLQLVSAFNNSAQHEFAVLFGRGEVEKAKDTTKRMELFLALATFILSLLGIALAPLILDLWTKGKISFQLVPLGLIVLASSLFACGQVGRSLMIALEKQGKLGLVFILVAAMQSLLMIPLVKYFGMVGAGLSLLIGEVIFYVATKRLLRRVFYSLG
jgi:O-antigen/teichoic acid export membrane protein